jgi:hypothetical protein
MDLAAFDSQNDKPTIPRTSVLPMNVLVRSFVLYVALGRNERTNISRTCGYYTHIFHLFLEAQKNMYAESMHWSPTSTPTFQDPARHLRDNKNCGEKETLLERYAR